MIIKSVSSSQDTILASIMALNNIARFDADVTYGHGGFWKKLPQPKYAFDIEPLYDHVIKADSTNLPLDDNSIRSLIFDPPFLTYVRNGRKHGSVMGKRFSGYWSYSELETHYKETIREAYRILKNRGIMVVKCQDIIHNHKLHPTHIFVYQWASGMFRLKDMFILLAKHRMPAMRKGAKQKHARIYHSYFMVFEKQKT